MLKKFTTLLFLTTAYAFIVGHSIIPHHHHDTTHELTAHHQCSHHHGHDDDRMHNLFSHFVHPDNGLTFTTNHNISNIFSKQVSLTALLAQQFCLDHFVIPPLLHSPPDLSFTYTSPHSLASGLRAPPIS